MSDRGLPPHEAHEVARDLGASAFRSRCESVVARSSLRASLPTTLPDAVTAGAALADFEQRREAHHLLAAFGSAIAQAEADDGLALVTAAHAHLGRAFVGIPERASRLQGQEWSSP